MLAFAHLKLLAPFGCSACGVGAATLGFINRGIVIHTITTTTCRRIGWRALWSGPFDLGTQAYPIGPYRFRQPSSCIA